MRASLAQNLPPELLGEIFILCLPERISIDLQPSSNAPPLVLTRVCSSWRNTALGTAHLWNELSMKLTCISTRYTFAKSFPRKMFDALEFWGSHTLLPSLHFQEDKIEFKLASEELHKLVLSHAFFHSPVILNARLLTLDEFYKFDPSDLGTVLFNNLEYLAVSQPGGNRAPFQFPICPALRRLHVEYHTPPDVCPTTIVTAHSWGTITHLSAKLTLRRQNWHAIIAQCVNMTSCSVTLELNGTRGNTRRVMFHHNLRTLSVQGGTREFTGIFRGFVFPSVVALRLSSTDLSLTSLENVHPAITATPGLKEFHLHFCSSFSVNHLYQYDVTGPLSRFAPGLTILVIDRINTEQIPTLLRSSWLNDDCPTLSYGQLAVEFIVDKLDDLTTGPLLVDDLNREIDGCGSLPFRASTRYVPGGLWNWKKLNARELRDCWDDTLAFRSC